MASAHVSAVAAMVIAAGTAGDDPKPAQVARRLKCTAHKLKPKRYFRGGMLDAVRAVRPKVRCR